jgi:isochorismate hydrolase
MVVKELYLTNENKEFKVDLWKEKLSEYSRDCLFKKANSALIVVDMQHYFIDKDSHANIPSSDTIIENVAELIEIYRSNNLPVIFTKFVVKKNKDNGIMGKWWKDTVYEGESRAKIIPLLKPRENELVITKKSYGAFHNKELRRFLKINNIKNIIITGVATDLCCDVITRGAFLCNFQPHIVIDATAASNEELHLSSLRALGHGFAYLRTTKEILGAFSNEK